MLPVARAEIPAALDWLAVHAQGPVFLESNLRAYGLGGRNPYSLDLWRGPGGLVGLTTGGILLPQMTLAGDANWPALRPALAGRDITALIGVEAQVRRAQAALDLIAAPKRLDRVEPAFSLTLSDLVMPAIQGLELRPVRDADVPLLIRWNTAYRIEILGDAPLEAEAAARANIALYHAEDSHRILWQGETPVAMTGFNAPLPDLVQVGGVYTPPALRRRGFARAAVALHLADARAQGIARARLFAANAHAARAYAAIGFRAHGHIATVIQAAPQKVQP